jgi:peptide deformylase
MATRPVLLVPDPRLKQPCAWVENFDESLLSMIRELEETRAANPGCVGIAACQIGEMSRVAIVNTAGHKKYGAQSQGHMVLINPIIIAQDGERIGREGCLSLPDFTANVRRSMNVSVKFQDGMGQEHEIHTTDFEAVVIQHEIDHLDGILFLDRVANLATDVFPRKKK